MLPSIPPSGSFFSEPKAWRLAGFAILLFSMVVFLALGVWIIAGNPHPGWFSDSLFYLILADFYSGHAMGDVSSLSTGFYWTSRFPPLFPIALSLSGAGVHNWAPAYYVVLSFGMLSFLTSFLWLRQQTGLAIVAAGLMPLALLSPQYFFLHLEVISESQFVVLMTVVFWLVGLCEQKRCSLFTVAAAASLVPFSRTAGFAVLLAVSVWVAFKRRDLSARERLFAAAVMWLPPVAWVLYRRMYPVVLDYVSDLSAPASAGLQALITELPRQIPRLITGYATWFDLAGQSPAFEITIAVLVVAILGWFLRVRNLCVDAVFLPIYLALVAVWPYPFETARLLSVTMPIIALNAWYGLVTLFSVSNNRARVGSGSVMAIVILLGATLFASTQRWVDIARRAMAPLDPELAPAMRTVGYFIAPPERSRKAAEIITQFVELNRLLPDVVDKGDCVWTPFYAVTAFLTSFEVRLYPTPTDIDSAETARTKLSACRYILVVDLVSPQTTMQPFYPATLLPNATPKLLSRIDDEQGSRVAAALLDLRP